MGHFSLTSVVLRLLQLLFSLSCSQFNFHRSPFIDAFIADGLRIKLFRLQWYRHHQNYWPIHLYEPLTNNNLSTGALFNRNRLYGIASNNDYNSTVFTTETDVDRKEDQLLPSSRKTRDKSRRSSMRMDITRISNTDESPNIKPWSLGDSFNSTTIKLLLTWQEDVSTLWSNLEKGVAYWLIAIASKLERDIRTTAMTGEYISRRAFKDSERLTQGIDAITTRPLLQLSATANLLSTSNDSSLISRGLLRRGIDPTLAPRLLTTLQATSTKQRAGNVRTQALAAKTNLLPLSADSIYRSINEMPAKLQYDYQRRKVIKESSEVISDDDDGTTLSLSMSPPRVMFSGSRSSSSYKNSNPSKPVTTHESMKQITEQSATIKPAVSIEVQQGIIVEILRKVSQPQIRSIQEDFSIMYGELVAAHLALNSLSSGGNNSNILDESLSLDANIFRRCVDACRRVVNILHDRDRELQLSFSDVNQAAMAGFISCLRSDLSLLRTGVEKLVGYAKQAYLRKQRNLPSSVLYSSASFAYLMNKIIQTRDAVTELYMALDTSEGLIESAFPAIPQLLPHPSPEVNADLVSVSDFDTHAVTEPVTEFRRLESVDNIRDYQLASADQSNNDRDATDYDYYCDQMSSDSAGGYSTSLAIITEEKKTDGLLSSASSTSTFTGATVIVETTAESSVPKEKQVVDFAVVSLDVILFLLETVAKSSFSLLTNKGPHALDRIRSAYYLNSGESVQDSVSSLASTLKNNQRSEGESTLPGESVQSTRWKIHIQLKS